jgi:hypothetical protein
MIFFFGCWDAAAGHHLYDIHGRRLLRGNPILQAVPLPIHSLDGLLAGPCDEQSVCALAHVRHDKMWTILQCADYTADSRPGGNAAILREGQWSFEEMVQCWRRTFPAQFARVSGKAMLVLRAGAPAPGTSGRIEG